MVNDTESIQLAIFQSFGKFMNKYGPNIRPEPNAAGFYAGSWVTNSKAIKADKKDLENGFERKFGSLMKRAYKILDERNKTRAALGLTKIQILNDVVRNIGKHPRVIGTQGKQFGNSQLGHVEVMPRASGPRHSRSESALCPATCELEHLSSLRRA